MSLQVLEKEANAAVDITKEFGKQLNPFKKGERSRFKILNTLKDARADKKKASKILKDVKVSSKTVKFKKSRGLSEAQADNAVLLKSTDLRARLRAKREAIRLKKLEKKEIEAYGKKEGQRKKTLRANNSAKKTEAKELQGKAKGRISDYVSEDIAETKKHIGSGIEGIKNMGKGAYKGTVSAGKKVGEGVSSAGKKVGEGLSSVGKKVGEGVSSAVKKTKPAPGKATAKFSTAGKGNDKAPLMPNLSRPGKPTGTVDTAKPTVSKTKKGLTTGQKIGIGAGAVGVTGLGAGGMYMAREKNK